MRPLAGAPTVCATLTGATLTGVGPRMCLASAQMSDDGDWIGEEQMEYDDYGDSGEDGGGSPGSDSGYASPAEPDDDDYDSKIYLEEQPSSSERGKGKPYTIIDRESLRRIQVRGRVHPLPAGSGSWKAQSWWEAGVAGVLPTERILLLPRILSACCLGGRRWWA